MTFHQGQPVIRAGAPLSKARVVLILIHGRGAGAQDILGLGEAVAEGSRDVAFVAPQAADNSWYPQRFLVPAEQNEPHLSSALGVIEGLVDEATLAGVPLRNVLLAGFSQGACLSLEFIARHPARYAGVFGLSGALIGPLESKTHGGGLEATPVYLGCSDRDAFIPLEHVEKTAEVLGLMGAEVTKSIFPGMGHIVNGEELAAMKTRVRTLVSGSPSR